ncbi:MAG: 30S ribosomal protein S1 [Candidatus Krumholzibacteriota bacterium]|nr:30S ribosomal protein S1 [Candidatus Krumholzibacteriota bacterium]
MVEEKFEEIQQGPGTSGKISTEEVGKPVNSSSKFDYLNMFEKVSEDELNEVVDTKEDWIDMIEDLGSEANELREGKIVRGTVYSVHEKEIILDVGFKSEGTIPISEFANCAEVKKGDVFDVFLEKMENQDGLIVLSKMKADFLKAWDEIKNSYDESRVVKAKVDRRIKGGLVVKLMGVDAFLPGSQIALRQVPNLDELISQEMDCKIIKLNKRRRNIVVSRRVVLEEEREEKKKTLLEELKIGEDRQGVVKNITDFGAFVDLGGIDGLLHLTDLTWGRVSHPSEVVAIGDKLNIKILDFDRDRERISLGLKQLTPYPWEGVEERYPIGKKMRGKVVSITDYGAFVELEKGIEGLIHISEMSWTRHVKHPSKMVAIGDTVEAVVLNVDKEHEKISLGLKQLEPDPWKALENKYPPGTRLKGKIRNLTNFGAFVEIEDGIDGLVHISDMSWAKRIRHPSEMVRKGEEVEVIVLEIDSSKRRISLGMKQTRENPWSELANEFTISTESEGTITRILDRGAVVELRDDVEGFVPLSHLGIEGLKKPTEYFDVGAKLPLKVIKIDPQNKRIVLSVNAYLEGKSEKEISDFKNRFPRREVAETVESGKKAAGAVGAKTGEGGEGAREITEDSTGYEDYDDIDLAVPDEETSLPLKGEEGSPEIPEEPSAEGAEGTLPDKNGAVTGEDELPPPETEPDNDQSSGEEPGTEPTAEDSPPVEATADGSLPEEEKPE